MGRRAAGRNWVVATLACAATACGSSSPAGAIDAATTAADANVDAGAPADAAVDPTAQLFDMSVVRDFYVDLPPASYDGIYQQEASRFGYCDPRDDFPGTLTVDGHVFDGVGVRARGNGTATHTNLDGKPSLKVNLEWDDPAVAGCPAPRGYLGEKHLTFMNMIAEPSFIRIPIAQEFIRAMGVPAPRTAYARLHLNGDDLGIYVLAENLDRRFLSRWFPDNDGMMYEGCYVDLTSGSVPAPGAPEACVGGGCWQQKFSTDACSSPAVGANPTDWELLRQLTEQLEALPAGQFYPGVTAFFDFDRYLSAWASMAFFSTFDSYLLSTTTYRVYHDPSTGKWTMLIPGAGDGIMRFNNDSCNGTSVMGGSTQASIWAMGGLMVDRCLAEQDCKDAFAARMFDVIAQFGAMDLVTRVRDLHAFIWPQMLTDTRMFYWPCGLDLASHQDEFDNRIEGYVVPWLQGRVAEVESELAAAGYPAP